MTSSLHTTFCVFTWNGKISHHHNQRNLLILNKSLECTSSIEPSLHTIKEKKLFIKVKNMMDI